MRRRTIIVATLGVIFAVMLALALGSVLLVPSIKWRVQAVLLHLQGEIPDIELSELLSMIKPGSPIYMEPIVKLRNPYAVIRNPYTSAEDIAAGATTFRSKCAPCHGADATGGTGPALATGQFAHGGSSWAIFRTITRGVPGSVMPAFDLDARPIWQVVAYLRSLSRKDKDQAEAAEPTREQAVPVEAVTYASLLHADEEPENWLTYSGSYNSQRHSRLEMINRGNAANLALKWIAQLPTDVQTIETSPLVVGSRMYLTEPPHNVVALDAATGKELWHYNRPVPKDIAACCGLINRGLAILGKTLFLGTLDAHLVAISADTGAVLWDVSLANYPSGYSITAAPLAVNGKVIVGMSGGEYGTRGFLDAYDAQTGQRVWRFYTVPGPGEAGSDTWEGDSWKTGGGATWMTGSFDPELNLVYWGVGNPGPVYQGNTRKGDNLFTCSIIAVDADSGKLAWYFQFTPHDEHDWDSNQIPVLVDAELDGKPRKLLLTANKNGFYYVLDRETGEFLHARALINQNWADGIDPSGRPMVRPESAPSTTGTLVYPGASGAANWASPSYNPQSHLIYVPVVEQGSVYFQGEAIYDEGKFFVGSASQLLPAEGFRTGLRALDPGTGKQVWEFSGPKRNDAARLGGSLSTAGGLVFWGDGREFVALDSDTGAELWQANLGANILAAPITFAINGQQRVTIAAGRSIFTFGLP